jgi:ubiquitin-conjugating enzyme E2 Z
MQDPFGEKKGVFDYQSILSRLEALRVKLADKMMDQKMNDDDDSADSEPMSEDS